MVHRISNHVGQRIYQTFDDRFIDLGSFPFGLKISILARQLRSFAYNSCHPLEERFYRLCPDGHDTLLYVTSEIFEFSKARG